MSFENMTIWRLPNVGTGMNPGSMSYTRADFYSLFSENGIKGKGTMSLMTQFFGLCPNPTWNVPRYIGNISRRISWKSHISEDYWWKACDRKKFHVRPKAQKAKDIAPTPDGKGAKKFCYWFNNDYVREIVEQRQNEKR